MILETKRLHLREWQKQDYAPFAAMSADPCVMQFFPALLTRQESDANASRYQSLIAERGWGFWALELKETGSFIGFTGLHIPSAELPFAPCVEIGWRLTRAAWGKGLATEAASACLGYGFTTLGLHEIVSFTALVNTRSRAVMERLAMSYALSFEHPAVPQKSPLRPHCLYRLTCTQWAKAQRVSNPAAS